ncbi:hypothetical protein HPB49_019293 [Dermacentor silvarum]|uniref:Uncharacterized protein n=1 Tax=Dermacentor silvarum TaxID=543639 RepID=A0ACB8CGW9_DERSI|nr:hypothetical protein HPB49_019293 [Dermacentor silvarum]
MPASLNVIRFPILFHPLAFCVRDFANGFRSSLSFAGFPLQVVLAFRRPATPEPRNDTRTEVTSQANSLRDGSASGPKASSSGWDTVYKLLYETFSYPEAKELEALLPLPSTYLTRKQRRDRKDDNDRKKEQQQHATRELTYRHVSKIVTVGTDDGSGDHPTDPKDGAYDQGVDPGSSESSSQSEEEEDGEEEEEGRESGDPYAEDDDDDDGAEMADDIVKRKTASSSSTAAPSSSSKAHRRTERSVPATGTLLPPPRPWRERGKRNWNVPSSDPKLASSFSSLGRACPKYGKFQLLPFADHLLLLAEDGRQQQKLVDIAANHLKTLGLAFNSKKSAVLRFSGSGNCADALCLNGLAGSFHQQRPNATWVLTISTIDENHWCYAEHKAHMRQSSERSSNILLTRCMWGCSGFMMVRELWKAVHVQSMTFVSAVLCLSAPTWAWLEGAEREVGRLAIGFHGRVAVEAVQRGVGWSSFEVREASS